MKTVAITGAGNGIGRALALHYAAEGCSIVGIDIDETGLTETERLAVEAGGRFRASLADLCRKEDRRRILGILQRRKGADVFIHNAGLNLVGPFEDLPFENQRELIALNLTTPMILTRDLLAHRLLRENGSLVFMSSLSFFVAYPGAAVYAGTKDGLAHYARSLRMALKPRGYHVLTVYPGPSRTPMAERCSPDGNRRAKNRMAPERVAGLIARAVEKRRSELVPGMKSRVFASLGTWAPGLTERAMRRVIYDRLDPERNPGGLRSR